MHLDSILPVIAEELSLPAFALNDHGVCQFSVDERLTITIEEDAQEDTVHVYATVARADESHKEALFSTLLEAQLFGREVGQGMAFGYEPATDEVLLCLRLQTEGLDAEAFLSSLTEFINWSEHWQEKLGAPGSTASADADGLSQNLIRA